MKLLITALVFMSLAVGARPSHHVAQNEDDHGPNLPKVGSSLFDKLFSVENSNREIVYQVPYPIGALTTQIKSHGADLAHAMAPFSRSLQRPVDLSYDPILSPRLVLTDTTSGSSLLNSKHFLGFVKARDQLEVISYNDEAGRFEFQIVKNYSKKPKVMYVERGKCLSCHQNQAPIFSVVPWDDVSFTHVNNLFRKKLDKPTATVDEISFDLFGEMKSRNAVPAYDRAVRRADDIAFQERVWVFGCGESNRCRLGLLLKTLVDGGQATNDHFKFAQETIKISMLKKQSAYSSLLRSHDMGVRKIGHDKVASNEEALLKVISNISNLSKGNNPATKRREGLEQRDLVATFLHTFSRQDIQLLREDRATVKRVENLLVRLYEQNHSMFSANSVNKLEIMATITSELGLPDQFSYQKWLSKKTAAKELFAGALQPIFQRQELNILSQHCHKCHATGGAYPPQFLVGS